MVRGHHLAERTPLPEVRIGAHPRGFPQVHALLVHGLPFLLLGQDWHRNAGVENPAPQVGHRDLPVPDQPQERLQHEAPARHRRLAAYGVVNVAPDQGGMGR